MRFDPEAVTFEYWKKAEVSDLVVNSFYRSNRFSELASSRETSYAMAHGKHSMRSAPGIICIILYNNGIALA